MIDYLCRKVHNLTHPILGRILMLHRVVEQRSIESEQRKLEVTPQFLEQTIKEYQQRGYRFVSIDQACDIIAGKDKGKPFVCLTFDDGYQDNYDIAYPLLKRLNVPFTIYITTGFVDKTAKIWWYEETEVMNWDQIKALSTEPLCTIGAHTVSHPRLTSVPLEEVRREIVNSKQRLGKLLAIPIKHFSYPHGDYNEDGLQLVKEAGFTSSLKAWGGNIRKGDASLLELPRIELREP